MNYIVLFLIILLSFSCNNETLDKNWRDRTDLVDENGNRINGEEAEKAGLIVYETIQFLIRSESTDTLDLITRKYPWEKLNEFNINKDILQEIKAGYTFSLEKKDPSAKFKIPRFHYYIDKVEYKNKKYKFLNARWKLKNHSYSFQDENGDDVEIGFLNELYNLPIKTTTEAILDKEKTKNYITYNVEIDYVPKNIDKEIKSGLVSFDMFVKSDYERKQIDITSKDKLIDFRGNQFHVKAFTKDFAVLEMKKWNEQNFKIITQSKDGKRYAQKRTESYNPFPLSGSRMNFSKLIWDYVEKKNYDIEKEEFLTWFAMEILRKKSTYSKNQKEEKYMIIFSMGELESIILYTEKEEKIEHFSMKI